MSGDLEFIPKSAISYVAFFTSSLNYQIPVKELICSVTFNFRILWFNSTKPFHYL